MWSPDGRGSLARVVRLTSWEAPLTPCTGRQRIKKGYTEHVLPRFRVLAGRGTPRGTVVCRACATRSQMDAIRAEERSRRSGSAESADERGRNRPARLRLSTPRCYVPPVDVNLLYLQSSSSVTGRDALRGRSLLDAFRRRFTDVHLAYSVVPDQEIQAIQE